jgi:hypothetical protein
MPTCPRCHQSVDSQTIACPYCRTPLKAHGHPGIPLHRAAGETYLCDTCIYHEDDTCNYPQRPYAKECTLYHDRSQPIVTQPRARRQTGLSLTGLSFKGKEGLWIIIGLFGISLLIAWANR